MAEDLSPFLPGNLRPDPSLTCREIAGELQDMASWLVGGGLSPQEFRDTLTILEARKVSRFGFTLSSAISPEGIVHFSLRIAETGELCASMDVDLDSSAITVQSACA